MSQGEVQKGSEAYKELCRRANAHVDSKLVRARLTRDHVKELFRSFTGSLKYEYSEYLKVLDRDKRFFDSLHKASLRPITVKRMPWMILGYTLLVCLLTELGFLHLVRGQITLGSIVCLALLQSVYRHVYWTRHETTWKKEAQAAFSSRLESIGHVPCILWKAPELGVTDPEQPRNEKKDKAYDVETALKSVLRIRNLILAFLDPELEAIRAYKANIDRIVYRCAREANRRFPEMDSSQIQSQWLDYASGLIKANLDEHLQDYRRYDVSQLLANDKRRVRDVALAFRKWILAKHLSKPTSSSLRKTLQFGLLSAAQSVGLVGDIHITRAYAKRHKLKHRLLRAEGSDVHHDWYIGFQWWHFAYRNRNNEEAAREMSELSKAFVKFDIQSIVLSEVKRALRVDVYEEVFADRRRYDLALSPTLRDADIESFLLDSDKEELEFMGDFLDEQSKTG